MSLFRRVVAGDDNARSSDPLSMSQWVDFFNFNGIGYPFVPTYSMGGDRQEEPTPDFVGYVQGVYRSNGIVFACMAARMRLFSEARFQFRTIRNGRPGDLFGTAALKPLERPYKNGTTGDLLTRAVQDVDLGGNWFARRQGDSIVRMRPDWMTIIGGSETGAAEDAEPVGYLYHPGGPASGHEPVTYLPEQIAHWAPVPDPLFRFRGMSWLTPVIREIMGDSAATTHKLKFFENGATPNLMVSMDPKISKDNFEFYVKKFKDEHQGVMNAYKTLFMGGGASATVIGADMKQIDFKTVQGGGETRIAAAAGVPPIIVGLSEGLAASTYSNYAQARRAFADMTMRPLWRNFAASIAPLIKVPNGSELWYDDRDISFLQEDQADLANIQKTQSETIHTLVIAGFKPESAVKAVLSDDYSVLEHSGMYSVQLTPAGSVAEGKGALVGGAVVPAKGDKPATAKPAAAGASDEGRVLRALLNRN